MTIDMYYSEIAQELKRKSDSIKIGFSTHALSAGENREDIVGQFLQKNLPKAFGISTGLILSNEGEFSNQADLIIVDELDNAPLYPDSSNKLWLVESVYAMIEVKTSLTPNAINDSINKCRRFKKLTRNYQSVPSLPRIKESLFIIWGFEGPSPDTLKKNFMNALKNIPIEEQPDFIIIPDSILITSGSYRKLSKFGMKGSQHQQKVLKKNSGKTYEEIFEPIEFQVLNDNSTLVFITWFTSWLKGAGVRSAPLDEYLGKSKIWGTTI